MSRTVESVIMDQLGSLMLQSAQLIAKFEAAQERIAELEQQAKPAVKLATKPEQKSNEVV